MLTVVDFSHPLTEAQRHQIAQLAGESVERVIDCPTQFDVSAPFGPQMTSTLDALPLSSRDWQTLPLVVVLPSFSVIAAVLLAELHGRTGYFPTVARLRPVASSATTQFEVAELVNLEAVRSRARESR